MSKTELTFSEKEEFVEVFKQRTKDFVLRSIRLFQALPKTNEAQILGKQFLRSASSTGANYRAACRARSKAEFYAKLSITIEEADEALFWMEVLCESEIIAKKRLDGLMQEAIEIVKVLPKARKNT